MRTVVPIDDSQFPSMDEDEILTRYIEQELPQPALKFPVISLTNNRYFYWCICTALLSIWSVFSSPFFSAFIVEIAAVEAVMAISIIVDIVFMFDLILNFRTSYINSHTGEEVMHPSSIAFNYLISGKLFVDMVSSFPYDYLAMKLGSSQTTWKSLSFLRILRAYRLSKLVVFLRARDEVKMIVKFLQLLVYLIMYVHVIGCIFFLLVSDEEVWMPPTDTIRGETEFYSGSLWRRYWFSFYHSVFLLVGVEIFAVTKYEYMFTVSCYICGAIINAIVVGEMAVISTSLNRKETRFAEIADSANTTMKNMKLPEELQLRIFDYLLATQNILEFKDELEHFEQIIPPSLQQEVRSKIYYSIIENNYFFRENPTLSQSITKTFKTRFCQPDEDLVTAGEDSASMFFLATGKCEVEVLDEHRVLHLIRYLKPGDFFGEVGLIYKTKRTATVRTSVYSNLAVMSNTDFYTNIAQFPDLAKHLKEHICKYKDSWRCFLLNAINKVAYLRHLPADLQNIIIYSFEVRTYDANITVIAENSSPREIMVVVEGSLSYKFKLKTSFDITSLQDDNFIEDDDSHHIMKSGWMRMLHESKAKRSGTRSRLNTSVRPPNEIEACLGKVGCGCVLNASVALAEGQQICSLSTLEPTTVLVLNISTLERLAKSHSAVQLRNQMEKEKSNLVVFDKGSMSIIKKVPSIDIINNFPADESRYRRKQWNYKLKLTNAALRVINRNREIKVNGIPNVRNLCIKLRAVIQADERGFHKLSKEIARGEVDPDVMGSIDLLNLDEISRPLLKKFALVAKQSTLMVDFLNDKFNSISFMLSKQNEEVKLCDGEVKGFAQIVDGIEELVSKRKL